MEKDYKTWLAYGHGVWSHIWMNWLYLGRLWVQHLVREMLSNSTIVHQTIIHLILPMKVIEFHLLGVPNGLQAEKVCCACLLSWPSFSPSPLGAKKGSFEYISSLTPPTLSPQSCPRVLQPDSGLLVEQTCLQAPGR